jgi:diguanylate cyclase (GGDEF)-like protein
MTTKRTLFQATQNIRLGFGLILLFLIIFVMVFSWVSWQSEKQDESNVLSLLAELGGQSINSYFTHFESNLSVLSQDMLDENETLDLKRARSLLKRFKEANSDIVNIHITDLSGQFLASAIWTPGMTFPSLDQESTFILGREALLKGQTFNIGRPYFGQTIKEWVIPLRYGVRDKSGELVYILNAALPLSKQQRFWQNLYLPGNTEIGLLRDDSFLLSIYPLPKTADINETYEKIRTGALAVLLRQQNFPLHGIAEGYNTVAHANYNFYFYRLPNYQVTFFVTAPISKLHAKWWKHNQPFYLLTLIFSLSGFGIYCWAAKRQAKSEIEREQQEALIWKQANYDTLTELPNRSLFHDRLEQETMKAHRTGLSLGLLFIDLDRFKVVNDTLGHGKGDVLLVEAARRISGCVRETKTVARLGGDEFTIILTEFKERMHLERIAQDIIQALAKPFDLGDGDVSYISASIGITLYPDDASDLDELIKHADQAMYAAKAEGRNRFSYFTSSMQIEAQEKLVLTNDLRQALAQNELEVYYQPIIDMATGRITKAEALLRWKHPTRSMVSPVIFIPLAEESGLILEIGEWVFQEVITRIEHWLIKFGRIIQVSVNVSPIQFEKTVRHMWMERLANSRLPAGSITVEITEGLLIKDVPYVKQRLIEFWDRGIEVSIDDFGTGFSALSYLKQFDIDYLKIDRSFVSNLIDNECDKALTEAIIMMAHKLGIKTIAEGVETEAQRNLLVAFGCDYVQGYFYSRPVPTEEFERLLAK